MTTTVMLDTAAMSATLERVRELVCTDTPFEHVEAYIEGQAGLDDEQKAVCWLFAWFEGDARFMAAELGRVQAEA